MKNTRNTVRRHFSPWILLVWLALAVGASIVERLDIVLPAYLEEDR